MFNLKNHSLIVLKDSKINPRHLDKISEASRRKRDRLMSEYTEMKNGECIVKEDICFDSPSGAALFCVGGSSNGWSQWKDNRGQSLDELYRHE